jgi:translation initiation factor IF-1
MGDSDHIELDGEIVDVGAGGIFSVRVGDDHTVLAKLAGKLRMNKIRVVLGDQVKVKVSTYDPSRGFITFRGK